MFDMNRDEKTDAMEWAIGVNILSNQEKHKEKHKVKLEQSLGRNKEADYKNKEEVKVEENHRWNR
ncbi:MAG: hypothetical protein WBI07_08005 [Mobilitalea sp.]